MSYPFHPAADLFPLLPDEELAELAKNIRVQGLEESITLVDGQIVDGRNRYRACQLAEVEPSFKTLPHEINPWDYSWSKNAERRHLAPGMKAALFEEYAEHSTAWVQEQERVKAEGQRQREAAAAQKPRTSVGTFESAKSTSSEDISSGASNEAPVDESEKSSSKSRTSKKKEANQKTAAKKGQASGASRATQERAAMLKRQRPDLHKLVCTGHMSLNAAIRQMKRETLKPVVPPSRPSALRLYVASAEALPLPDRCVDIIVTSPPYNIGPKKGKPEQREDGQSMNGGRAWVGIEAEIPLPEAQYQRWQLVVLKELFRVARPGASLFYNHKVRQHNGAMIHPMQWLLQVDGWTLRQEIIWDRGSTHNHESTYFWPHDERIYWLTKGKPRLVKDGINQSTVWSFHGPVSDTWHASPFPEALPRRCLTAIGAEGKVVLDPFGGSMTVCQVALALGASQVIGCDKNAAMIERARREHGWQESP